MRATGAGPDGAGVGEGCVVGRGVGVGAGGGEGVGPGIALAGGVGVGVGGSVGSGVGVGGSARVAFGVAFGVAFAVAFGVAFGVTAGDDVVVAVMVGEAGTSDASAPRLTDGSGVPVAAATPPELGGCVGSPEGRGPDGDGSDPAMP